MECLDIFFILGQVTIDSRVPKNQESYVKSLRTEIWTGFPRTENPMRVSVDRNPSTHSGSPSNEGKSMSKQSSVFKNLQK
jgi:hypothetical protein